MTQTGDLINIEYQYEFRGWLFGSGTDTIVRSVSGLLALPEVRNSDIDRLNDHGATPGISVLSKRTVSFDVTILGSPGVDIESKVAEARTACQPPPKRLSRTLEPLAFWRPGAPKKVVYGRCERRDFESNYELARGKGEGSFDIVCPDSFIYGMEQKSVTITLAIGATTGQVNVFNFGDFRDGALCTVEIQGPATNAIVANSTDDNRQIKLDGAIAAGETFVLDQKTMEATLDGDDAFTMVRNDSQYWALLPGQNTIVFSRAAGATSAIARCTIRWQDTYA